MRSSIISGSASSYPIVAHCHLRWDWVWQRPQQFLSRFAKRHPVLFVETHAPTPALSVPELRLRETEHSNLLVAQVQFPAERWHDGDYVDEERHRLVRELLEGPLAGRFERPVQWFYDPMATTAFAGRLNERAIVYDCMDELSQFRGAPPNIVDRERQLLAMADVVFAGGSRLHAAKSRQNRNCHFYGCGVDVEHFGTARLVETALPGDLASLPAPRLGYFGVVDERIDYELLAALADGVPEGSVVVVGPAAKVDPGSFPRRSNLHWLGGRPYAALPAYVKGFSVCLMPFALNEATEFINPTKALEYMATGRPIVSTAVPDVITNFGTVVEVARSGQEFVDRCRTCLERPDEFRIQRGLQMAQQNTWEVIVAKMEAHIQQALERKESAAACPAPPSPDRPGAGDDFVPGGGVAKKRETPCLTT